MRILVTADLHYDIARSVEPARRVADEICAAGGDVLLFLGDAGGQDLTILSQCLHLFDRFTGRKLFVAGNHDIWVGPSDDSLERLEVVLPKVCDEAGFHALDIKPLVLGDVGFVGTMGWYDYSFRPAALNIPLRFYRAKIAPGAATRLRRYESLVADCSDIPPAGLEMGTRWMDGEYARLPMGDVDFCHRLHQRFVHHIHTVAERCRTIVAGLHHLPFAELMAPARAPAWAFGQAYMGSEIFGETLLAHPQIRHAFCGHSHYRAQLEREHLTCTNVGCTYVEKRFEVLDL